MINVTNRRCEDISCQKHPHYNIPGEKSGKFCNEHKQPGMVNVKSKKCQDPNCQKHPLYNFPGEKSGLFCNEHKQPGMVDVKSKRCQYKNCQKQSYFNFPGENKGLYCNEHKQPNMIDVISKRCRDKNCQKIPYFNDPEEKKGIYCNEHKQPSMVDVKHKKCQDKNCNKIPSFNIPGKKDGVYCKTHAKNGMINVRDKRCITDGCQTIVHTDISKKYGGFCHTCAVFNGIANVPKNIRVKERAVIEFLNESFSENLTLTFDKQTACSRKRPDMYIDFGNFILVVEVDENQHRQYDSSCERRRVMEIQGSFGEGIVIEDGPDKFENITCRPIVFIRFNPDNYQDKNGKEVKSCFKLNSNSKLVVSNKKAWLARLNTLKETMNDIIAKNDGKLSNELKDLEVIHLYYNSP